MITQLKKYRDHEPLTLIMGLAILFRILSVIFARGWGMIDDHFIVVESAQSWVDGYDYNYWLPGSPGNTGPTGHNMFYPGIHYILFTTLKWLGIEDPNHKMFVIRLLHGLLSLVTVWLGYRITETLGGKRSAAISGILLAILWFMPWGSVRNLVEMTSIPFIMAGFWFIIRDKKPGAELLSFFLAGLFFGIAFNIRPQTALLAIGAGIVILTQKKWKEVLVMTAGSLLCVLLVQGGIDYALWGRPFAELIEYLNICFTTSDEYITLPWYNYFFVILLGLIPPVSFFLLFGFIRKWKDLLILVLPAMLFFIFHSYYPNKQERFILPFIPLFIIAGTIGWQEFVAGSKFWTRNKRLLTASWSFFWVLNIILLLVLTFSYSKRARVESMLYLSKYPDIEYLMVIDEEGNPEMVPRFYLGQWPISWSEQSGDHSPDSLLVHAARQKPERYPRFILFTGEKNLSQLVTKARTYFPWIVYEKTIHPGFIDRTLHKMNPHNRNRTIYIYRNRVFFPQKRN